LRVSIEASPFAVNLRLRRGRRGDARVTDSERERLRAFLKRSGLPIDVAPAAKPGPEAGQASGTPRSWRLAGHALGLAVLSYLAWNVAARGVTYAPWGPHSILGILDGANFLFHEAGHVIFMILGPFMTILGGSLTQVVIPAVCAVRFSRQRHTAGVAAALFWTGESLSGVATYAYDGRARRMPLHGDLDPGHHDWFQLLTRVGLLEHAELVGGLVFAVALGVIVIALGVLAIETLRVWQAMPDAQGHGRPST
jgi:hypothetical protein